MELVIGAIEFERRRRAVGLRVPSIGRNPRRDLVGEADDRIDAVENILAEVDSGAKPPLASCVSMLGDVEPRPRGRRELWRDIKGVERKEAVIGRRAG